MAESSSPSAVHEELPEDNEWVEVRRRNGFERPLRHRQRFAISVYVATGFISGAVLLPLLVDAAARWSFAVAFWLCWLGLGVSGVVVMCIDPADPGVGRSAAAPEGEAEDEGLPWCTICKAHVRTDSKHCWECNKCVGHFDHHCPWLNTCVGTRNYLSFFATIWCLIGILTLMVGAALALLIRHAVDAADDGGGERADDYSLYGSGEDLTTGFLIGIVMLYSPLWCLDFSLVAFHCFLCIRGITTYEYLTGKRPKPPGSPAHAVEIGERSMSGMTNMSSVSVATLTRATVNDFLFGSSEATEPWSSRDAAREAARMPSPRHRPLRTPSGRDPSAPRHGAGGRSPCSSQGMSSSPQPELLQPPWQEGGGSWRQTCTPSPKRAEPPQLPPESPGRWQRNDAADAVGGHKDCSTPKQPGPTPCAPPAGAAVGAAAPPEGPPALGVAEGG